VAWRGDESLRGIARRLGRSPSTVSREVARSGGRGGYRACQADRAALRLMRRPKVAKLARCAGCVPSSRPSSSCVGLRSRSRVGCRWSSPTTRRCGCRTRRSTCRCSCSPGCAAQGTHPLPADASQRSTSRRQAGPQRPEPHPRHGEHRRTARRGRGPGGAGPLGRRPALRPRARCGRHAGRTTQPVRATRRASSSPPSACGRVASRRGVQLTAAT
jgi:Helix-turn-helix domain